MVAVTLQEGPTDLPLEAIPQVILLLEGCSYLCPIFLRKSIPLVISAWGGGGGQDPLSPPSLHPRIMTLVHILICIR